MLCEECNQDKNNVEEYIYVDGDNVLHKKNVCDDCAYGIGFNPALWRSVVDESGHSNIAASGHGSGFPSPKQ